MRGWVQAHDLRDDDGELLRIDRRRLRTTFIAQRGQRQWSLRAAIDPNHSPQAEGDHYLSAVTPAQKAVVEEIARDAQGDLLRRASAALVVDEAASAAGHPEEVHRLGLAENVLAELLSGQRTRSARPAPTSSLACTDGTPQLPFDPRTGAIRPEIWQCWLGWDPVRMAPLHAEALRSQRAIWIDAGTRDEWFLDLGAQAFRDALAEIGVDEDVIRFELFDGGHHAVEYRMPPALAWLSQRIARP